MEGGVAGRRVSDDFDLLIQLERKMPVNYSESCFGIEESLENILGKPVDLVEIKALRNPYFFEAIEGERVA